MRYNVARQCNNTVDFLVGYRYAELEDQLLISDSVTTLVPFPPGAPVVGAGTSLSGFDQVNSVNRFHGGLIGFSWTHTKCRCTWELLMNLGVGNTSSEVLIDGSTVITLPPAALTSVQPGSKLALPSNMGRYQQDSLSIMPEIGLRMKCCVAQGWQASVGYTFMYWSQVSRAGDQFDFNIDPGQFPAPNQRGTGIFPEFRFCGNDFWAQGIGLRLEHQF